MSNILITGASGMIGLYLTSSLLHKGHKVIGTDSKSNEFVGTNPNYQFTQCDITDKSTVTALIGSNSIDVVVHLANSVDNDIDSYITDDEIKRSKICDKFIYSAADKAGVKIFILLSTTSVYGSQKGREPIREDVVEKGGTNYADLKLTSEKIMIKEFKKSSVAPVIVRVAPIYSAEYTQNLRDRVYDSKEDVGYIFDDGNYGFSFCCVFNLIDFINGIISAESGRKEGIYNVADKEMTLAKDIIAYEQEHHRINAVVKKSQGFSFGINKSKMKSDYRYFDPSATFSNWCIDITKAKRFATFRWNLKNTK